MNFSHRLVHRFVLNLATVVSLNAGLVVMPVWANSPATAEAKVDVAKGKEIVGQVCASCHGADGNASAAIYPKLAGQHPEYLSKQLHNFKVKAGATKAERENAVMAGFAATLSEEDIRNVSGYLASQKQTLSAAKSKELSDLGRKIYTGGIAKKEVPACAGCHSPNGAGMPAQYPRLAGQHATYIESQLNSFRKGERRNNTAMMSIASRMNETEIQAVSDYIAGLR
jgi:cbb3-type cytochrome c oxidase subunit III